jgi:asparagine synthase (glutamine-hydrolysing)
MCGVSFILSRDDAGLPDAISRMVSVMAHRGPDASASMIERAADGAFLAFGHNRLSIIDLSEHAAQPKRSKDGRYVLLYNGEVYNYREIAGELDTRLFPEGYGDTAVVLAALAAWGPAAFARFNGMWAILLYDAREKTLLVSRDRFGVKPLYYYQDHSRLYFASEIKAIVSACPDRFKLNADVAVPYLTRGLLNFGDETFFAGIRQFPAASYQFFDLRDEGRPRPPERYWRHPVESGEQPEAGRVSVDEIRDTFIDAVKLRLRSDVPVGVLLSGGIDSSSIVGASAALGAIENLTVLSVTSDDPLTNEGPFIDEMARWAGLIPHKVNVSNDPLLLWDRLPDGCWFNDEPVCGVADLAEQRLMELARSRGIKVLLSGQGADEQLGGYTKFLYFWLMNLARDGHYLSAAKTFAQFARHSTTFSQFTLSEAIRYLGRSRLSRGTFIAPAHQARDTVDIGFQGSYARREWIDLARTSVPALLHYEDRMSMSCSVEIRVPFLDYRVVECLARVHPSEKFEGGWTKSIFRKAVAGLVPPAIQYRRDKKGFTVPESDWMRGVFRERATKLFESAMLAESCGLLDRARLNALFARYQAGKGYLNGRHFFRVCAFEAFLRKFEPHLQL